jgi:hypothetical protein
MTVDLDPERLLHSHIVIGALGAVVGLKFVPGVSWVERMCNLTAGTLCSWFWAPALIELLHIERDGQAAALSFAVGMFALSWASAFATAAREIKLAEIVKGWLGPRG